jgi:excinuclease ABC subunit A
MDTLYAEGQRRYVESLVQLCPAVPRTHEKTRCGLYPGHLPGHRHRTARHTGNTRSTVGSMTEVYDFLRLLYARIGKFYSPVSGEIVQKHEVSDVIDFIKKLPEGARGLVLIPFSKKYKERTSGTRIKPFVAKRLHPGAFGDETLRIEDILDGSPKNASIPKPPAHTFSTTGQNLTS